MRSALRPGLVALWIAAVGCPMWGQGGQYIVPGTMGAPTVEPREAFENALRQARWHLGPLRLDPWMGLREIAWVDPGSGQKGDLTATVGAGLHAYLPTGARGILAAHILPEYTWWRDHKDARHLAGREGIGYFLYGNRLAVALTATTSDLTGLATSAVDQRARIKNHQYEGKVEIPVASHLSLFGRAGFTNFSAQDPGLGTGVDFSVLDRRDSWQDGGVRWWLTPHISLGAGAGRTKSDFASDSTRDRSNDGSSWFGELQWRRAHTNAAVTVRHERRTPAAGSTFQRFEGYTGSGRVGWSPPGRFRFAVYGLRDLSYSVQEAAAEYVDRRTGGEIGLALGRGGSLAVFREQGQRDFRGVQPNEDVTSTGARFQLTLFRALRLGVHALRTRTSSPLGARTYSQVGFEIVYHGGSGGGGTWY